MKAVLPWKLMPLFCSDAFMLMTQMVVPEPLLAFSMQVTFLYLRRLSNSLQWPYNGLYHVGLRCFQILNCSIAELSHNLHVASPPSFCCSCADCPLSLSFYGALAPSLLCSLPTDFNYLSTLPRPQLPLPLGLFSILAL